HAEDIQIILSENFVFSFFFARTFLIRKRYPSLLNAPLTLVCFQNGRFDAEKIISQLRNVRRLGRPTIDAEMLGMQMTIYAKKNLVDNWNDRVSSTFYNEKKKKENVIKV
ncbi:MAG: hypothetical protein O7D30_03245, partial [Rickettsia endosymbiont of Ixodes persulcatus]|nr:hypothetical protein [Rickettsia endosymbiont of Ixodes persulcatus]